MSDATGFSADELASAYKALNRRCLSDSAEWVLSFIMEADADTPIEADPINPRIAMAKACFISGEYQRAIVLLDGITDQDAIGIKLLAQLNDCQRSILPEIADRSSLMGILPPLSSANFKYFQPLAAEVMKSVDSFDPLNLYIVGMILSKAGKYKDAVSFLAKSISGFPLNRSAWKLLVHTLQRFDDAVVATTLGALPPHWISTLFKIEFLAEIQQTEAAIKMLPKICCPRTSAVIALEALVYYHHRDFDRAQVLFDELRKADPMKLETLELYSNLLFVREDRGRLSQLTQALTAIDKFRPETLVVTGNFFSMNGRHEDAIAQFAMALRFDETYTAAWTLIGHEFMELGDTTAAISAYSRAIGENPRDFRAIYGVGRAYTNTGMQCQAIKHYQKAVTINPFDSRMWIALGECYEDLMEKDSAIKCYQRAVCNIDNDGIAIYRLAKLYKEADDEDRAAYCYENYLDKYVTDNEGPKKEETKEAILFLANYFRSKRDLDKAEMYAQRLMFDATSVAEGNALLKDIRSEGK